MTTVSTRHGLSRPEAGITFWHGALSEMRDARIAVA